MSNIFPVIVLAIFLGIFIGFCRLEWKKYQLERQRLADSFAKSEEDFLKHQSKSSVDNAYASKEMYQRLKKQQLDRKIREEYRKSQDANS